MLARKHDKPVKAWNDWLGHQEMYLDADTGAQERELQTLELAE